MNATENHIAADDRPATDSAPASQPWWRVHAPGIFAALFFAAVIVGPRWYLLSTDPPEGVRIHVNAYGASSIGLDEALYWSLIREAHDGHIPIRDPFIEEDSGAAPQTGSLWDVIVGVGGHAVGGDVRSLAVVTTIAAVLSFLLYYALAWRLTGSRLAAVSTIAISMVGLYVVHRSPGFLALRHWEILRPLVTLDPQHELQFWTRFLAPAMPLPLFLGSLLVLPSGVLEGKRLPLVGAGLIVAALIYTYLFFWVSLAVALGMWMLWLALRGERASAIRVAAVLGIGFLVALPELVLIVHNGMTLPDDVQARVGAFGGIGLAREWLSPVLQRFILGAPFAFLALRGPNKRVNTNALYVALYIAPLLPAATRDWFPQTDHFLFQTWPVFSIPLFIAGGVEGYRLLSRDLQRVAVAGLAVAAVVSTFYFTTMQMLALRQVDESYAMPADEYAVFNWIKQNLHESDTVVTPSWITNQELAALTPASTYLADGFITRTSTEELADRYLRVSAAYGIEQSWVFYRIDPERSVPVNNRDIPDDELERYFDSAMVYYLFNEGLGRPDAITGRFPTWRQHYEGFVQEANVLAVHHADYLFCGHRERFWDVDRIAPGTWVREAFRQGEAVIFQLVAAGTPNATEFDGCRAAAAI